MRVSLLDQSGLLPAIIAMRLPKKSSSRSDTVIKNNKIVKLGCNDIALLTRLIRAGDEHAKAARGIIFYLDITAPRYWWQEMSTYRIGVECLSSESTMHIDAEGLTGKDLQKFKGNIKEGYKQRRILMMSAQALRRIYKQRYSHRLPEWRIFCKYVLSLNLNFHNLIFGSGY